MKVEHIQDRLHRAIHRASRDVSRKEFEEITGVVLIMLAELAAETALIMGEMAARIEALEEGQEGQSKT